MCYPIMDRLSEVGPRGLMGDLLRSYSDQHHTTSDKTFGLPPDGLYAAYISEFREGVSSIYIEVVFSSEVVLFPSYKYFTIIPY